MRHRAAVAALVLCGLAGCTAAPSASPAPVSTVEWTACALPGGTTVRAVLPPGRGTPWLAAGRRGAVESVAPAVWTSPDGCAWTPSPVRTTTLDGDHTEFSALARSGSTTVALGGSVGQTHGNTRPTLWRATGTGPLTENLLDRELFGGPSGLGVTGLVAGFATGTAAAGADPDRGDPPGFLAIGAWSTRSLLIAAQVWVSPDGRVWRRLDDAPELVGTRKDKVSGAAATTGSGGAVLVGAVLRLGASPSFDGRAWYAPDGLAWRSATVSGLDGAGDQKMLAVAPRGDGYVALAVASGRLVPVASADGRSWTAGAPLPGDAVAPTADVAARLGTLPDGDLLAAAVAGGRLLLWRSADGASWTAVTPPADRASTVALATAAGRTVLALSTPDGPRAWTTS